MSDMQVYHVQKGHVVKMPRDLWGDFSRGDCYLVSRGDTIYLWCGEKATPDERFIGALTSLLRGRERRGAVRLVTVEQGKEPKEFLDLFGGKIEVTDQDTEGILQRVALKRREFKLFRVRIEKDLNLFMEVPCKRSSLTSDDVYLLDTFKKIYIWHGKGSTIREKHAAMMIAQRYDAERVGVQQIIVVDEGKEPKDFLDALP